MLVLFHWILVDGGHIIFLQLGSWWQHLTYAEPYLLQMFICREVGFNLHFVDRRSSSQASQELLSEKTTMAGKFSQHWKEEA